jgi:hypothetical protein
MTQDPRTKDIITAALAAGFAFGLLAGVLLFTIGILP